MISPPAGLHFVVVGGRNATEVSHVSQGRVSGGQESPTKLILRFGIGQCARDRGFRSGFATVGLIVDTTQLYEVVQRPPGRVGCGSAGDGVSVRSRRYWPAGREWNKTLLEEGFCILGARSPFLIRSDFSVRSFPTSVARETTACGCDGHRGTAGVCLQSLQIHSYAESLSRVHVGAPLRVSGFPLRFRLVKSSQALLGSSLRAHRHPSRPPIHELFECSSVLFFPR